MFYHVAIVLPFVLNDTIVYCTVLHIHAVFRVSFVFWIPARVCCYRSVIRPKLYNSVLCKVLQPMLCSMFRLLWIPARGIICIINSSKSTRPSLQSTSSAAQTRKTLLHDTTRHDTYNACFCVHTNQGEQKNKRKGRKKEKQERMGGNVVVVRVGGPAGSGGNVWRERKKKRKKMGKDLRGGWGREGKLTDWIDGAPSKERTNKELNVEPMFIKRKKKKEKKKSKTNNEKASETYIVYYYTNRGEKKTKFAFCVS